MKITEGYMPFMGYKTYYRTIGECRDGKSPLILLHGGPGSSHNYFEVLDPLAEEGRMLIMYDQLGCGKSQTPGRTDLFTMEVWRKELMALIDYLGLSSFHILGQSFGGMLLLSYVCTEEHTGLKSLILASTLPSSKLWGQEQHRMIRELPWHMQEAIRLADETGIYEGKAYQEANDEFMLRHCSPIWTKEDPECLTRKKGSGREAYVTAWGPNEFTPMGNLKDFNHVKDLKNIREPALITSGCNDLSTPLINKLMFDEIPDSKWELFADSRHMAFAEENEAYMKVLSEWLQKHD